MVKDYEIIIDENATKLESVDSGFGPNLQRGLKGACIFWQLEPNQSKMLLIFDLINENSDLFYDLILFKRKTKDKDLLLATKLLKQVKIPDWKIKKNILLGKKTEIENKLNKDIKYIKNKIKTWTGYNLKPINIFLVYAPDPNSNKGAGGHGLWTHKPAMTLRISLNSKINTSLIIHEMLHVVMNKKIERNKMLKIDDYVEEAIFDLLDAKIYSDLYHKIDWENEIKERTEYRGQQYKKYIYELYKMLKPILHGKDDLIWKYIDWKKLEKIKKGK